MLLRSTGIEVWCQPWIIIRDQRRRTALHLMREPVVLQLILPNVPIGRLEGPSTLSQNEESSTSCFWIRLRIPGLGALPFPIYLPVCVFAFAGVCAFSCFLYTNTN